MDFKRLKNKSCLCIHCDRKVKLHWFCFNCNKCAWCHLLNSKEFPCGKLF
jgi:hypothetical protein